MSRPRIRSIKPELWQHRAFQSLSTNGRLTFIALISNADDEGRLATDAGHIASAFVTTAMPDEIAVQLARMEDLRMVMVYAHRGDRYVAVLDYTGDSPWSQKIDHPRPSDLPVPPKFKRGTDSAQLPLGHAVLRAPRVRQTYFLLRGDNQVKIGTSRNVAGRQATLEAATGPLTLLAVIDGNRETWYQATFAALRTHGEWFRYEDPLRAHVEEVIRLQKIAVVQPASKGPIEIDPLARSHEPIRSNGSDRKGSEGIGPERIGVSADAEQARLTLDLAIQAGYSPVEQVFIAWLDSTSRSGRTVLDDKRRRLIGVALKLYPLEDVLDAVDGWKYDSHHRGENDRGRAYNDLELILRDPQHIERFRDFKRNAGATPPLPAKRTLAQAYREQAAELRQGGKP